MKSEYLMGLDVGTTGCKAVVFDINGNIKGYGFKEYPIICDELNQAEQDAEFVYSCLVDVMMEAVRKSNVSSIKAISLSVQGDATMPVDENYRPLHYTLLGMDYRTMNQCKFLEEKVGNEQAFYKTGMPIHPINTLAKILWFRDNRPEVYERANRFVTYSDFIMARLGGEPVIDITMASRSMAMDLNTREWSREILDACGVDVQRLSMIRQSGEPCGQLSKGLCEKLGLKGRPELITGGHDQPCGAIGAGIVKEGMAVDSNGTAEVLSTVFKSSKLNKKMLHAFYPCYLHAADDLYFTFALNHVGGILLRWYRDNIAFEEVVNANKNGMDVYEYIQRNIKNKPSNIFVLPHFNGSGTPVCDVSSKGAILGLTLSTNKDDIFKGILDSLSYELKINIETMYAADIEIKELRAVGGGAKSPLWMQTKADILDIPITTLKCKESGCLGAAILAAVGSGIYSDIQEAVTQMVFTDQTFIPGENKEMYKMRYDIYKKIYPTLRDINALI